MKPGGGIIIWHKSKATIEKPEKISGPICLTAYAENGNVLLTKWVIMGDSNEYSPSEAEYMLVKRMWELARDITVACWGYKVSKNA